MWLRPQSVHAATAAVNQQAQGCHTVTVPPTGPRGPHTLRERYPWLFIQPPKAKGRAFVHTAMGHSENGIPSEYEQDFLPSVWHSVRRSCILNFRVAFNRKQLYMIVGCECVPLRWKIFSFPYKALAGWHMEAQKSSGSVSTSAPQRFRGLQQTDSHEEMYYTRVSETTFLLYSSAPSQKTRQVPDYCILDVKSTPKLWFRRRFRSSWGRDSADRSSGDKGWSWAKDTE